MDQIEVLQGWLISQDLVLRGLLAQHARDVGPDGIKCIRSMRSGMLASLQLMQRDCDEKSDRVWAHATDFLNTLFDEVEKRLESLSRAEAAEKGRQADAPCGASLPEISNL
ncbi:hypothetical protein [Flaviflagellibacter deserti]|uniref:Uncharacterized protein n=1 Tax=Flaviflagellibacter deserti TaxID=2267266 RepID=A0ABV9Z1J2_9HYPH